MGADAPERWLVGGFAKHRGGHQHLVCFHSRLCCYRFSPSSLNSDGFACVYVRACVCLRRCGISGASPKWGRDGAGGCGVGRTTDNSSKIKIKLTYLKWFTNFSNNTPMNTIFYYKLKSYIWPITPNVKLSFFSDLGFLWLFCKIFLP